MEAFTPSAARLEARRRKRRVLLQLDALGEGEMRGMEPEAYLKFLFGYPDEEKTQIDGIYWDFMFAGDFYAMYDSRILPRRTMKILEPWLESGFDMMGELTRGAKCRGLENILVHRISEVDIGLDELDYAAKRAHPDWQLDSAWYAEYLKRQGESGLGLLNLANPEVRAYKAAVLSELLEKYDWDGLEIDLCRHTPFLPHGAEWENRGALTDFMRTMRGVLDRLEKQNGHPYLLSVRTGETPEICKADGVDLETWLGENLIDSVTAGGRSFSPDIEGMRRLLDRSDGVQLYATLDFHHAADGYVLPPAEVWRGVCASWYARGVDGVKLFNWWTSPEALRRKLAEDCKIPSLLDFAPNHSDEMMREFGDRERVLSGDRTFVAERRGGYPWADGLSNRNVHAPLPLDVDRSAHVPLHAAGELDGRCAGLTVLLSEADGAALSVSLNGRELCVRSEEEGLLDATIPPRGVDWASGYRPDRRRAEVRVRRLVFAVDAALIRQGFNDVKIGADRPVRLEKLELSVRRTPRRSESTIYN